MLEQYRHMTRSVNTVVQQEFHPGIVMPDVISLITFKGTLATSVKEVSAEDLYNHGLVLR